MKCIVSFFYLCSVSLLSFANTCPPPNAGYVFRVAAWGNHSDDVSQIRCYYYRLGNESDQQVSSTYEYYRAKDMENLPNWHSTGDKYYLCTSFNTNIYDCAFGHK